MKWPEAQPNLPPNWMWATIREIADTQLGKMLDSSRQSGKYTMPYLRNANVRWHSFDLTNLKSMDIQPDEYDRFLARTGDVLITEGGEIGRAAVWRRDDAVAIQKTVHRMRPFAQVDPIFLAFAFEYMATCGYLEPHVTGVTIKHLTQQNLREVAIPVPPLAEQRRITAVVEEHVIGLSRGAQAVRTSAARSQILARSLLRSLIGAPWPSRWRVSTVAEAGHVDLGRQRHPDWHTGDHPRPYLRVANVFEDRLDLSDVMEMDFPPEVFERFRLLPGDILLNEGQSPHLLGRPAMYRGQPEEIAFTNSLLRFRTNPDVLPEWALLVFRYYMHSGRFKREVRITTNIAHLSAGRFKSIEFPIPPMDEQQRIIDAAHRDMSYQAELERSLKAANSRAEALRRAVLAAAFRGELVDQDPTDEPADVLLARIRAEREAATAAAAKTRNPRTRKATSA